MGQLTTPSHLNSNTGLCGMLCRQADHGPDDGHPCFLVHPCVSTLRC